jgi:hypothetical protein
MTVRTTILATVAALMLIGPAHAAELEITKGLLDRPIQTMIRQVMTVKYNGTEKLQRVNVECGFFHGNDLVAVGNQQVFSIEPETTVYVRVMETISADTAAIDRADCRVAQ